MSKATSKIMTIKCFFRLDQYECCIKIHDIESVKNGFWVNEEHEYDPQGTYWVPPSQILFAYRYRT